MLNAFALLALFSSFVVASGQSTSDSKSQQQDTYNVHIDEDGMEVFEVYGGDSEPESKAVAEDTSTVAEDTSTVAEDTSTVSTEGKSSTYLDDLDDEDTEEEDMDDLINRLGKFRKRAENAQSSKSQEAIMARFYAGLDDDDEDESESGSVTLKLSGEALIELLQTGKLPDSLSELFEVETGSSDSDIGPGIDTPAAPKKKPVPKDPPAVITTYHDQVGDTAKKDNPIVLLSRFNFDNNVLASRDDEVENWIIRFCHDWYSPCDRMLNAYQNLARETEDQLNTDSMKTVVRFAEVDCSTDKPLCNAQGAESFPKLIHYHRGSQIGEWEGNSGKERDQKEMKEWMEKQSETILKNRAAESSLKLTTKDNIKALTEATFESSWSFSCAAMLLTVVGHICLVRMRPHGASKKMAPQESNQESEKPAKEKAKDKVLGPSGLGSMLPEEWVSKTSKGDLIEL